MKRFCDACSKQNNMASEQKLLADLKIPAEVLPVFKECGVNTAALITWTKQNIVQALSRANVDWKYDVIWGYISEWRKRNNLSCIEIHRKQSGTSIAAVANCKEIGEGSGLNCNPTGDVATNTIESEGSNLGQYPVCCGSEGSVEGKTVEGKISHADCSPGEGETVIFFGESSGVKDYLDSSQGEAVTEETGENEDTGEGETGEFFGESNGLNYYLDSSQVGVCVTEETNENKDTNLNSEPNCNSGAVVTEASLNASVVEHVDDQPDSLEHSPDVLKTLLKQSVYGAKLLESAEDLELTDDGQKFVTDVVAKYHLSRKRKTTSQLVGDYASVIVKVFKKEQKDTYYVAQKGNPLGKLYSRINYIRQADNNRIKREDNRQTSSNVSETIFAPEILNGISWLQLNRLPWANVLSQWEITFPDRKALLGDQKKTPNLLKKYPHLKDEFGFQLLDIDYRLLGFGDPSTGQNKWEHLLEPIGKYIAKHGKDISVSELLPVISSGEHSLDSRLLAVLRGLSTVLIPVKAGNGFKPTIATAQSDTYLMVKTKEEAFEELEKLRNTWTEQGGAATPKLIVLGDKTVIAFGECIVAYGNVHYSLPSILRGIDVYVKLMIIVLGLPPSKVSKLIWLFILKYVYSIDKTKSYVSIKNLIKFLESCL